jgi:hypothetical protein
VKNNHEQDLAANNNRNLTLASGLIGLRNLRDEYGLARDLSARLLELLPHVSMGRTGLGIRRMVQRRDFEQCLALATRQRLDLVEFVRAKTPAEFAAWFEANLEPVAA